MNHKFCSLLSIYYFLIKISVALLFTTFYFLLSASSAEAASLYFAPSSGSYAVGTNIAVSVYVSSSGEAMNAASGVLSFTKDKLEVVSLSKGESIFSLWVQEPSFSNLTGAANFEGIVLNPGFTGSAGKIITVNFKAKSAGTAYINFSSGSVLANDGSGTNILSSLGSAQLSLGIELPKVPEVVTGLPAAPQISSSTHPDQNEWYNASNAKFTWPLPSDIVAVKLLYNTSPSSAPTIFYDSPISEKEINDVKDGSYYLHVQLKNKAGWSGVSHFRFQIDTQEPSSFAITEISREDATDPRAQFDFDAQDEVSGIDHYEIQIDEGALEMWKDDGNHRYENKLFVPGKHTLKANVFDKAGNFLASSIDFLIEPLDAPEITEYPKELTDQENLIIRGASRYPNAQVIVWIQKEGEESKSSTVQSNNDGTFTFVSKEKLPSGTYKIWAEVVNTYGARSLPSEKLTIAVTAVKSTLSGIIGKIIIALSILIPIAALIIILLLVIWHGWHKFLILKKRHKKEVEKTDDVLYRALVFIKDTTQKQVKLLSRIKAKRELTEKEEKAIIQIKESLHNAGKLAQKEIEDIEKDV